MKSLVAPATVRRPAYRRRGSAYILILSVAMLLTVIGLAALLENRIEHRTGTRSTDMAEARLYALSAIDLGLYEIDANAAWRTSLALALPTKQQIGRGTLTVELIDPMDGDIKNNTTDPVRLTGIGMVGEARHKIQVTVEFVGGVPAFQDGSWKQVVD